jgi:hypothetical protein
MPTISVPMETIAGMARSYKRVSQKLLRNPLSSFRYSTPLQGAFAFAHANCFAGGKYASRNPCYAYSYVSVPRLDAVNDALGGIDPFRERKSDMVSGPTTFLK